MLNRINSFDKSVTFLLISHAGNIKGTTDYFIDYLNKQNTTFIYLRHPLDDKDNAQNSVLSEYNFSSETKLKSFVHKGPFIMNIFYELIIDLLVIARVKQTNPRVMVIGFGSINVLTGLIFKFFHLKVVFWGVDYSKDRFGNTILNKLYAIVETLACQYSNLVIQPTKMQMSERIRNHKLDSEKAIIVPNGILPHNDLPLVTNNFKPPALIYIGSLSKHHGVLKFLQYMYAKEKSNVPIYIFGDGSEKNDINEFIKNEVIENIHFIGAKNKDHIENFIRETEYKLYGIAPYIQSDSSHVKFGDSLKVKEYINYGIPFISSNAVKIDRKLLQFGYVYKQIEELNMLAFENILAKIRVDKNAKNEIFKKYDWNRIFETKLIPRLLNIE